ncbi:MAG: methyltransferase domain-containing protein [Vicinamibacterales bacterium]
MRLSCPVGLDVLTLRRDVNAMYARMAEAPEGAFHFHRGPEYATRTLGYDADALSRLPIEVTARFAGVGNPHVIAPLRPGESVLDVGCGAGTDLLLAALRVGSKGAAIGVDVSYAMCAHAAHGAAAIGLTNVNVREGDATTLPVDDRSVDVVISNGVLNLVPEKERAIAEIARALKPGGRLQIADIVIGQPLPESVINDIDLWTG